jgi:hypothetical protein
MDTLCPGVEPDHPVSGGHKYRGVIHESMFGLETGCSNRMMMMMMMMMMIMMIMIIIMY